MASLFELLSGFDITPETGFVPDLAPSLSLPSHFAPVEALTSNPPLAEAISTSTLRQKVESLPEYDWVQYEQLSIPEQRRLFVILTFVAHGYIWGNGADSVLCELPRSLALPLHWLSETMGTKPLGSYASTVLWNARRQDPSKGWDPDNVTIDLTFTGSQDEIWFYAVSACVEARGGQALTNLLHVLIASDLGHLEHDSIRRRLQDARSSLHEIKRILETVARMNADVFYWKIRPYFAGWKLVKPCGVHYNGVERLSGSQSYVGISAAQSSLFQAFDIIFDVSHRGNAAEYLSAVRSYMPKSHGEFLDYLENHFRGTLGHIVKRNNDLICGFNDCVLLLAQFRTSHRSLATRFAVKPAALSDRRAFGLAQHEARGGGARGAGGTAILPFLGTVRDDTVAALV